MPAERTRVSRHQAPSISETALWFLGDGVYEDVVQFGGGQAVDPQNLPVCEAQASYLKRHGLLTKEELRRLKAKDFEPEAVEVDDSEGNWETGASGCVDLSIS